MSDDQASTRGPRSQADKGNLAAWLDLSHELRTPAHAILGHVELLLSGSMGPLGSEMRQSLGDIQRAAIALSTRLDESVRLAEALPTPSDTAKMSALKADPKRRSVSKISCETATADNTAPLPDGHGQGDIGHHER